MGARETPEDTPSRRFGTVGPGFKSRAPDQFEFRALRESN